MLKTIKGSFRYKFFVFVGGTIFIFLSLLTLISYYYLRNQSFKTASQQAQYSVHQLSHHFESFFTESKLFLLTLSKELNLKNTYSIKNSFIPAFFNKKKEFSALFLATEKGFYLRIDRDNNSKNSKIQTNNPFLSLTSKWYLKTMQNQKLTITEDLSAKTPIIRISIPIFDEGKFAGVIGAEINSEKLLYFLEENPLSYQGATIIFNKENKPLLNQTTIKNFNTKNKRIQYLLNLKKTDSATFDNNKYLIVSLPVQSADWNCLCLFPHSALMADSSSFLKNILAIYIVLIFLLSVIIVFLVSKLLKPVSSLKQTIRHITNGNIQFRAPIHTRDEFGELAFRFNRMADTLQAQNKEIGEHNLKLEKTVEETTQQLHNSYKDLKIKNIEINNQMLMAQRVQQNILPQKDKFPQRKELDFGARYLSVENVGGDLFDVIRIGKNSYGFLMADVSGHGLPAALITSMAKVSFHTHSRWGHKPCEICQNVNQDIFNFIGDLEHYFTASYCILDLESGVLQYANAGHLPIFIYHAQNNEIETLFIKGSLIGIFEKGFYQSKSIKLEKGDKVLLFTDGIPEARNKKQEFYQINRVKNLFQQLAYLSPQVIVDFLIDDLKKFRDGRPSEDDQAILCIEFKGCCTKTNSISKLPVDFQEPMSPNDFSL